MVAVGDRVLLVAGAVQVFTVVEILDDTQALVRSAEVYTGEDDEKAKALWEGARYAFPTPLALPVPADAG
ncbi:hypothetical protein AB0L82_35870 [Nocardia sp. NPDC052001]|uniref:hypothetical protein n=1 Tax=Nocardia sp. NPDC052001 TaxID=3154853 RepID=UPI00342A2D3F